MLLQTNSYVVPKEKRSEHARLVRRFKQCLSRLGCDDYEVYEQVGNNWTSDQTGGRFVQIMRFRDRRHQLAVQAAEKSDPVAQAIIAEFCNLVNFPYQQQQGLFAVGFYTSLLAATQKALPHVSSAATPAAEAPATAKESEPTTLAEQPAEEPRDEEMPVAESPHEIPIPASPFAEGPAVAEPVAEDVEPAQADVADAESVHSGRNGDSAEHASESHEHEPSQLDAAALDALIKQRFGAIEVVPPPTGQSHAEPQGIDPQAAEAQPVEHPIAEPHVSEPIFSSSGIGEVLDASLGDDPDLDFVLPSELLSKHIEEKTHQPQDATPQERHAAHPEHS